MFKIYRGRKSKYFQKVVGTIFEGERSVTLSRRTVSTYKRFSRRTGTETRRYVEVCLQRMLRLMSELGMKITVNITPTVNVDVRSSGGEWLVKLRESPSHRRQAGKSYLEPVWESKSTQIARKHQCDKCWSYKPKDVWDKHIYQAALDKEPDKLQTVNGETYYLNSDVRCQTDANVRKLQAVSRVLSGKTGDSYIVYLIYLWRILNLSGLYLTRTVFCHAHDVAERNLWVPAGLDTVSVILIEPFWAVRPTHYPLM